MKKFTIILLSITTVLYIVLAGFTGYYIGSKTKYSTETYSAVNPLEELSTTDEQSVQDIYNDGYLAGYEDGKIETFEFLYKVESTEDSTKEIQEEPKTVETTNQSTSIQNTPSVTYYDCPYCGATFTDSNEYLYHYQECEPNYAQYHVEESVNTADTPGPPNSTIGYGNNTSNNNDIINYWEENGWTDSWTNGWTDENGVWHEY